MATSNRTCLQCSTPLATSEASCSNCGTLYPEPPTSEASQSPAAAIADQPLSPTTAAPKVPSIGIIIGVLLLIIILLGSSLYFLLKGKIGATTSTPASTTVATINAGAASQPLFVDNFANNSKGWSTGNGAGFGSSIANNSLILAEANHKIIDEPVPARSSAPASFTDFTVTTTFTILKADQNDSVGLYLRGDNNLKQGYFIDIFGDNSYDIVKVFPDGSQDTFLVSPTPSSAINSLGQQNKLIVIMKGSKMVVLINNKLVSSITDGGYTSGQIALFAENGSSSNGINATFSNLTVYPAPSQLPV